MTPTNTNGKDLGDLHRMMSMGESEDGTVETDYESTPTGHSESNMEYSPTFVLPEIEEDDYGPGTDDATMMSTISRMSAPFIQFAPSILPGTIPEEALSKIGLNTLEAANKPTHVACVNSINFLSQPEPIPEAPEETPEAVLPMQIDVKESSKKKKKKAKRGSISTKSSDDDLDDLPPAAPKQIQNRRASQGGGWQFPPAAPANDDLSVQDSVTGGSIRSSGPSSVRSAPVMSAASRHFATNGDFKRAPINAFGMRGGPRCVPSGAFKGGRLPEIGGGLPRDPMAGPPGALVGLGLPAPPNRTSSLPVQTPPAHSLRSMPTATISSSATPTRSAQDASDDVSVNSRQSAHSLPVPRSSRIGSIPMPSHEHRKAYDRANTGPPPTSNPKANKALAKEANKEKKKGGMFGKLFSNHVQSDFEVDMIEAVELHARARQAAPGAAKGDHSDYGVAPSRSSDGGSQRSDQRSLGSDSVASMQSRTSRASRMSANLSSVPGSPSPAASSGVRLRDQAADRVGLPLVPPPPMMMDNPMVPEAMKLAEPPRATALVRTKSGRMALAPENDDNKKGRRKKLFNRNN